MKAFTVHARPLDPPESFAFVKDGFSWPALFFPVLWILWHRLWLTLLGYVIFILVVAWVGRLSGEEAAGWVAVLGALLFAFEANDIRRRSLDSRGFAEVGAATGRDFDEAEIRFFDQWSQSGAEPTKGEAMARAAYPPRMRESGGDEPIIGLFPEPER
jgi:hypothetical protein